MAKKKSKAKITPKQRLFCKEYLIDKNGTQAAIRAGYSVKCANVIANELLNKTLLSEFIAAGLKKQEELVDKKGKDVIEELIKLGFSNISSFIDVEKGRVIFKDLSKLTQDEQKCIASISETKAGISVKFYDKVKPLELLGKHFGVINEKLEIHQGSHDEFVKKYSHLLPSGNGTDRADKT